LLKNERHRHFDGLAGLGIQSWNHTWLTVSQLSNDFSTFEALHLSFFEFMMAQQQWLLPNFSFLSEARVVPDFGFSLAQLTRQLPHLDGSVHDDDFLKSKT
jgi:hypothetical protein